MRQQSAGGVAQIGKQHPRRGDLRGELSQAEALQAGHAELALQGLAIGFQVEAPVRQAVDDQLPALGQQRFQRLVLLQQGFLHQDLPGGQAQEFPAQPLHPGGGLEMGGREVPGGQVDAGQGHRLPDPANAHQVVVGGLLQQVFVGDRPGSDHLDDFPAGDPGPGKLQLLADGDLAPGLEQAPDVALHGVIGHAAHRHPAPLGQGQIQEPGSLHRVLLEHLVEVPQPEEQDAVRMPVLDASVLAHHGGCFGHTRRLYLWRWNPSRSTGRRSRRAPRRPSRLLRLRRPPRRRSRPAPRPFPRIAARTSTCSPDDQRERR